MEEVDSQPVGIAAAQRQADDRCGGVGRCLEFGGKAEGGGGIQPGARETEPRLEGQDEGVLTARGPGHGDSDDRAVRHRSRVTVQTTNHLDRRRGDKILAPGAPGGIGRRALHWYPDRGPPAEPEPPAAHDVNADLVRAQADKRVDGIGGRGFAGFGATVVAVGHETEPRQVEPGLDGEPLVKIDDIPFDHRREDFDLRCGRGGAGFSPGLGRKAEGISDFKVDHGLLGPKGKVFPNLKMDQGGQFGQLLHFWRPQVAEDDAGAGHAHDNGRGFEAQLVQGAFNGGSDDGRVVSVRVRGQVEGRGGDRFDGGAIGRLGDQEGEAIQINGRGGAGGPGSPARRQSEFLKQ